MTDVTGAETAERSASADAARKAHSPSRLRTVVSEYLPPILLFVAVGAAWEAAVAILKIPKFLLPAPSGILTRIVTDRAMLSANVFITMEAACFGLVIGAMAALILALLFLTSRIVERALFPWAIVIQTVPILAIAPLLTIWLGFGIAPKVAVAAIISIFPILVNAVRGLRSVPAQVFELMTIIGAGPFETFTQVRIFAALPYIFAGLRISAGGAVIGAIVSEFTGANLGIGTVIMSAGYRQDATMLFAAIFCSCAATIALFYVVVALERICLFWPEARLER
jgi:NitT/TauT family transport system permease protein